MGVVTEAQVRLDADLATKAEYRVPAGTVVTPSARAWLVDQRIDLVIGDRRLFKVPKPGPAQKPALAHTDVDVARVVEFVLSHDVHNENQGIRMNDQEQIDQLVELVWASITASTRPTVEVEASGRHVHVSREVADKILGAGVPLTRVSELSQPGQFVCKERIMVSGPKGEFPAVVILGPERAETQVEMSISDARILGVAPVVRLSGDLAGTPGIKLTGPAGEAVIDHGVMVAQRHIHMHPDYAKRWGLHDRQVVSVEVGGSRGVRFDQVILRVSPDFATFMHIDYDEANACGFAKGMKGTIIP